MAAKQSDGAKRKHVNWTVTQKQQLIMKLESGVLVAHACEEFGVKKKNSIRHT